MPSPSQPLLSDSHSLSVSIPSPLLFLFFNTVFSSSSSFLVRSIFFPPRMVFHLQHCPHAVTHRLQRGSQSAASVGYKTERHSSRVEGAPLQRERERERRHRATSQMTCSYSMHIMIEVSTDVCTEGWTPQIRLIYDRESYFA